MNHGEICDHLFGPALSLPYNAHSALIRASPPLVVAVEHAYTTAEMERIHRISG